MRIDNRNTNIYDNPIETLSSKYDQSLFLMACMSHSVLVLLRRNIGVRLLQPWVGVAISLTIMIIGYATASVPSANQNMEVGGAAMMIFGMVVGLLFQARRKESLKVSLNPDNHIHTKSRGESVLYPFFQRLRIPEWKVQRYVEPFLVLCAGLTFLILIHWSVLGWWLMISASCLSHVESKALRDYENKVMDVRDSIVEARIMQDVAPNTAVKQDSVSNVTPPPVIVTLSPELRRLSSSQDTYSEL